MKYSVIKNDDEYKIVEGRLRTYEIQHLNTVNNLAAATALDNDEVDDLTDKLEELEKRCEIEREALSKLKKPADIRSNREVRQQRNQELQAARQK